MTVKAELVYWLSQLRDVPGAVDIVTRSAGDAVFIHDTLHKVVALHPVLVCGSIRKVGKGCLTQDDVFEFPEILQMKTDAVAHRPIIGFAFDLFGERLPL